MRSTGKQILLRTAAFFSLLVLLQLSAFAQTGNVKGLIRNEKGEAVAGATVVLNNATARFNQSTRTDSGGLFRFTQVPVGNGYSIEVSHVGYVKQTMPNYSIKEGELVSVAVKLAEANSQLNEVVVVGYGTRSRNEVTGAVTSLKREDFNQGVFSSPMQLLQGKVAGLNVTRSGNPNENPSVILRGPSSFRANTSAYEPFYVIDGVPGANINIVAPDDIESMDVLKDAASTSIYGARAANGVIIVTTRKVRKGQSHLSYSTYGAIEQISNTLKMADANELRAYIKANGRTLIPVNDDGVSNTDWQKEVTRTGVSHNHNLSFNGSNQHSAYGVSVNYLNNEGIIKTSSMNRFVVRANLEHRAFEDRLKINLNVTNSITNGNQVPAQVYNNMMTYLPTVSVMQPDGSYTEDRSRTVGTGGYYNPVALLYNNTIQNKINLFLVNGVVNWNILPGLDFTTSISMQKQQLDTNLYYKSTSMLLPTVTDKGFAERTAVSNTRKIWESYANYATSFGKHNIKLLAGYSWQEDREGDGFKSSNYNFVSDELLWNNLGLGAGGVRNYGYNYLSTLRLVSFYGRASYDFNGKYLFQASLRRDGSSAFGANNRWGYFPAVSAGWNINREAFMSNVHFINALKLRAGYGVSGNSTGFNAYSSQAILGSSNTYFWYNNGYITSMGPLQADNPALKWERTSTVNVGIDFSIFNNKLNGSIDVYDKRTSDLIGDYTVSPLVSSFTTLTANVGKMSNKGIELSLNSTPVKTGKFSWTTAVNLAHNVNKIESISNELFKRDIFYTAGNVSGRSQSGVLGYQVIKEGLPLGSFYTLRYAGKDATGKTMFYDTKGAAATGNNTNASFFVNGSAQPKLLYGWNNTFRYGQFDLNVFVRGVMGNKILNATRADMRAVSLANQTNILKDALDVSMDDSQEHFISDKYIESGSYLRLDNVTLGYSLNTKQNYHLRFYVAANNLFVITKYTGIDPEINMSGQTPGIDNRNFYPKTRSFIAGLNVTF
ncbi:iron complex outermembrane receptor protein [Filimonas zeae]|uniref:SusC/RagA family TonB-linked outer membrane protein n=1 Tax=Filimonas zeae TaxID=1737353 RepID=UPI001665CC84|nr:SusC/RagA family TonB-linked outer membrane protein [Filimonas zeae]MDR6338863.1 iron complex outermembrane receptor protein [Filimonas zeae]